MRTLTAWLLGGLATVAAGARPAAAADKPVVAVLYFDNNTGDKELDVLQKGFADMMITDLAGIDGIVVVEREKLQSLLEEMKLQRGKYFDPKTAVKLGKGLGAAYAVTGSFAQVAPQIRIDMRMIEVGTGKVVLTAKVAGKASELFELEQKLVGQFVVGLSMQFEPPEMPRTKVPDVSTLVAYSHGIDLADQGQLEPASKQLATVVSKAPTFALARIRRDEVLKRLAESKVKREQAIDASGAAVLANAEKVLAGPPIAGMPIEDAKRRLAYRAVRTWFLARKLREHVSDKEGFAVVMPGQEAKAVAAMKALADNDDKLMAELEVYAKENTKTLPNGTTYLDTSVDVTPDDHALMRKAGMDDSISVDPVWVRERQADFLLMGECQDGAHHFTIGPPLANLEPRYEKVAYALYAEAIKRADALREKDPRWGAGMEYAAIAAIESWGEALLIRGRTDEAIAKWQEALDKYPTSSRYEYVENKIKAQLGVAHDHTASELARYEKGLKGCDDMDLRVGIDTVLYQRMRMRGLAAIPETVAEIEKACKGNPHAKQYWEYLYTQAALQYGAHGDCAGFEQWMKRKIEAGGSASDAAGYRKNYTKCPLP